MSCPSREHLLGYLLRALEPAEHEQVEQELQTNPDLRHELTKLERCLGHLGLDEPPAFYDPPAGLAVRTCQYVTAEAMVAPASAGLAAAMSTEYADQPRWRWVDLLVAASVLVVAASLFFPALAHSQFQASLAACQNNLRKLGLALHEFSTHDPNRQFPAIAKSGNRGVAGVYAPMLVSRQLVLDPRTFVCPTSPLARNLQQLQIPALDELDAATGATLAAYHNTMGGDYGYNMGYTQDGDLKPPCDDRRCHYVLLADAPHDSQPGRKSANHRGRGQNLLCEDGHTRWIVKIPNSDLPDDPFHNRDGKVAAGLDSDDAVLGASADRPSPIRLIGH
jgi:hypothetical protein